MSSTTLDKSICLQAIAFTGYPVTDLARARSFYENILGLKTSAVWEEDGDGWIEYDIGSGTLAITNSYGDEWKPSRDGPAAAFEVADFASAIAALREAGVRFYLDPILNPTCQLAVIGDPDGNSIAIHQRTAK